MFIGINELVTLGLFKMAMKLKALQAISINMALEVPAGIACVAAQSNIGIYAASIFSLFIIVFFIGIHELALLGSFFDKKRKAYRQHPAAVAISRK